MKTESMLDLLFVVGFVAVTILLNIVPFYVLFCFGFSEAWDAVVCSGFCALLVDGLWIALFFGEEEWWEEE